jgi:hypothetical protein
MIVFPNLSDLAAVPLSVLVLGALLALAPGVAASVWLIAAALAASVLAHVLYWILTAPVNKVWFRNEALSGSAQRLFGAGGSLRQSSKPMHSALARCWWSARSRRTERPAQSVFLFVSDGPSTRIRRTA